MSLLESSLSDLFNSTVDAFPNTTKRQHAIDPIKIAKITWMPYLGMKTLFVKGLAQSEGREYNPVILFKRVAYHPELLEGVVALRASDDKTYFLEPLSSADQDVNIRCNCKDFFWRMQHFDHVDKSLYGKDRKPYEALHNPGSANPLELPGMCKHLIKLFKVVQESKVLV